MIDKKILDAQRKYKKTRERVGKTQGKIFQESAVGILILQEMFRPGHNPLESIDQQVNRFGKKG